MAGLVLGREPTGRPAVALLHWGHVIEDFLDPAGLTLDDFVDEFTGSWMFGYADALRSAGVDLRIVAFSTAAGLPRRTTHAPSGTALSLLPAPRWLAALRRRASSLYARDPAEAFGRADGAAGLAPVRALALEAAAYGSTPIRALRAELRRYGIRAVLCQEYEFPRFDVAWGVTRSLGVPLFASFQGGDYQRYRLEAAIRPRTLPRAAGLVIPTASEAERVLRSYAIPRSRIHRIFNPVDLGVWRPRAGGAVRARLGIPEDALVVGWHGRVSIAQKGLDTLLDAWRQLRRTWTAAREPRLLLVGAGADSRALDAAIEQRGIERDVVRVDRLVADRSELVELLAAADVYALPSRHEGFPVALVEAIACGLPVVAAAANGVPDILDGGERSGGVGVERDDPAALAAQLGRLLGDDDLRAGLAVRARQRAEDAFSHEAVGAALRRLLIGAEAVDESA